MTTTIAISNHKGGTGKTTTAVSLGYDLAQRGHSVLIVDLDSQGHLAIALGHDPAPGLLNLLIARQPLEAVVRSAREFEAGGKFGYVPGDKTAAVAKTTLAGMDFREYALADVLDGAPYDFTLLDCAPSLDVLHVAALVAADWLLIPTECQHLAAVGIGQVITSMDEVNRQARRAEPVKILGILPTFYERVTTESHQMLNLLVTTYKELVLPPIPRDTKLAEAPALGRTIWEHAPHSRAVAGFLLSAEGGQRVGGYRQLTDRVLEIIGGE